MVAALLLSAAFNAQAERLKDIASISGVRSNQLIGYGLVVGLNGTGDQTTQTPFTLQTFNNMLSQFGIKVPAGSGNVQLKNVAAVSISADLPAFAKPGQQVDITVASIGNSKSLRGGTLLLTPLKGIDGNVYAIAQGNLVVGLNGTGDQTTQTPFTLQTFNNMLSQFGIKVPAGSGNVQLKNVAAVSISADLPAFAKPGQQVDITCLLYTSDAADE